MQNADVIAAARGNARLMNRGRDMPRGVAGRLKNDRKTTLTTNDGLQARVNELGSGDPGFDVS
jgi:hypothetical protein